VCLRGRTVRARLFLDLRDKGGGIVSKRARVSLACDGILEILATMSLSRSSLPVRGWKWYRRLGRCVAITSHRRAARS